MGAAENEQPSVDVYDNFDEFLKLAIRNYYDLGWKKRRGNFIALIIAAGQTSLSLAKDSVVDGSGTKSVAVGAATVLALRFGLKYALGGPLGMVLGVAAGASMVSYFFKNQREIVEQVGVHKKLIAETSERYEEIQGTWRDGKIDVSERNLMIDGLLNRFLRDVEE